MKRLCLGIAIFCLGRTFSQNVEDYYQLIDSNIIRRHAVILASDSLEGRNTGEAGQKKAAAYLSSEFRKMGLDSFSNSYLQQFNLIREKRSGQILFEDRKLNYPQDFTYVGFYDSVHLNLDAVPVMSWVKFKAENNFGTGDVIVLVKDFEEVDFKLLSQKSIKNVFFVCKSYKAKHLIQEDNSLRFAPEMPRGIFFLDGKKIKCSEGKACKMELAAWSERIGTENVVACVPGSDPLLKNEFVVVSAHYDHLGIKNGKIYNGADDNASGTSTLLELARVLNDARKKGEQPKRSVLFICFTGEEHGLFGSEYYSKHPLAPLNKTVADFNIDMIGRKDESKEAKQFSVYVIGSDKISLDFHKRHEALAKSHKKLVLDYTYNLDSNPEKLYYRSDHYNFAKNGIPSIFYFGGFHKDYHEATDDIEKLNFTKIKTIAELVLDAVWQFGN
ncbi:MAG: M28 family metallopeptidase [Bacteroidota bacterium]